MNKARRHELKMLHYRKRMRRLQINGNGNFYSYRSHGSPCSCGICRNLKYRDTLRKENKIIEFDDVA